MKSYEELTITEQGPVRVLTLDRPEELNAVNGRLHRELTTVWADLESDRDARVVVLTGAGRAFCAGGDFEFMMDCQEPEGRWRIIEEGRRIITEMVRFPLPIVAAVNGPAVGLGCSLAVLSDMVLLADTAHLADPHVVVGLIAGDGGAAWPAHVGLLHAKQFLLTGDRIDPETALRIGLATRVVPAAELMTEALALAQRLAALPQHAVRDTKRVLNMHLERALVGPMDHALVAERYSMTDEAHVAFVRGQAAKRAAREASSST